MTSLKKAAPAAVLPLPLSANPSPRFTRRRAGGLILAALVFAILALPQAARSASAVWDGAADTTWYTDSAAKTSFAISTAEQLAGLALLVNGSANNGAYAMGGKTITLADDILLNDTTGWESWDGETEGLNNWIAIGTSSTLSFRGTFNGAGHAVSGLFISIAANYQGLFGYAYSSSKISNIGVENFYVKGGQYVGGLAGHNSGAVSGSYASGTVSGTSNYVGGLIGHNYGSMAVISNSYATGNVNGTSYVGGLVGYNTGTISSSYAAGTVSRTGSYVGGLLGNSGTSATISNSYYDTDASGQNKAVGNWSADTTGKAEGKSAADMKLQSSFANWDFETVWEISGVNYPTFGWQNPAANHLSKASISPVQAQTWTGEKLTPKTVIVLGADTLKEGSDFEYSYRNNLLGSDTATLIITGKGGYIGSKTVRFYIAPASCGAGFFTGGAGTIADPYQISSAPELDAVHNCVGSANSGKYFVLTNNISLTDYLSGLESGWKPIGGSANYFYGKLDGGGYKVTGLWIDRQTENYIGLFGYLNTGAKIENLGVEIDNAKGGIKGGRYVGGLAGYNSGGAVGNSYASGDVSGNTYVGGLAGYNGGLVNGSYASGTVRGVNEIGGLIGRNNTAGGIVSNSYAMGDVSGVGDVGGLVGGNFNSASVINSYAVGTVSGTGNVGGLLGSGSSNGAVSNSYYDTDASGLGKAVGSWSADTVGKAEGKITSDMKLQSTFANWDFETVWEINSGLNGGYPILGWQNPNSLLYSKIDPIDALEYAGIELTPEPVVKIGETILTKDADYELSHSDNLNAGIATVTVKGVGARGGVKTATFQITPKALTVTGVTAENKEYDATAAATLSGATLDGVFNADTGFVALSPAGMSAAFADASAGENKSVSASGEFEIVGAKAGNYSLAQPDLSSLTASIAPKTITVAGVTAENKEYDATAAATLSGGALSGVLDADTGFVALSPAGMSAAFADANAGENKSVSASGEFEIVGAKAGNYSLAQPDLSSLTASIARMAIAVPAANAELAYNGALQTGVLEGAGYALLDNSKTNAGNYSATAILDGNHKWGDGTTSNKTIDWSIAKADPAYAIPTDLTAAGGQTLADVSLPNGWVWGEPGATSVGNVGTQTFRASFIPEDTLNYYGVIEDLIITVSEPTPIVISANYQIPRIAVQANGLHITAQAAAALEIYSAKGGLVLSRKFGAGEHAVSLAGLPRGVYLAKAKFGGESKTLRITVK